MTPTLVIVEDDRVSIDTTVGNAARIWKLYGTTARKGDEVYRLGRVHRTSRILKKGFTECIPALAIVTVCCSMAS